MDPEATIMYTVPSGRPNLKFTLKYERDGNKIREDVQFKSCTFFCVPDSDIDVEMQKQAFSRIVALKRTDKAEADEQFRLELNRLHDERMARGGEAVKGAQTSQDTAEARAKQQLSVMNAKQGSPDPEIKQRKEVDANGIIVDEKPPAVDLQTQMDAVKGGAIPGFNLKKKD